MLRKFTTKGGGYRLEPVHPKVASFDLFLMESIESRVGSETPGPPDFFQNIVAWCCFLSSRSSDVSDADIAS
jgi:hypothetical protein